MRYNKIVCDARDMDEYIHVQQLITAREDEYKRTESLDDAFALYSVHIEMHMTNIVLMLNQENIALQEQLHRTQDIPRQPEPPRSGEQPSVLPTRREER